VSVQPWIKLPPGVPVVPHGPVKVPFALRYEDIKIGTGAEGESGKLWHLKYTGWRAADGVKFDSWDQHPVMGPDRKPVLGPDGNAKLDDQPTPFQQGLGKVIPGFDYGLAGMRIGGKRRIFIPWQLGYGMRELPPHPYQIPGVPDFPGIPAKSDLIFNVELVDVTDAPAPLPPTMPRPARPAPAVPPHPGASTQPNAAPAPAGAPAQPSMPPQQAAPAQPPPK